jgi:tetratricopeptide (TPR) repeat protein
LKYKYSPLRSIYKNSIKGLVFLVLIASCSSKKNNTMSRTYHYITAYYNYYFNAYDSYRKGVKRAEDNYKYNYALTLPVLLIGDQQVTGMVGGEMDRAITKCTNLINKHSITVKPERKRGTLTAREKAFYNQNEYVRWATESWILIGKSQVWKGDYEAAGQTLEFILLQFPNTPIWYEAQLWLARISIIQGDFITADDKLKAIDADKKRPKTKSFRHLLASTWAFFYLKQGNSSEAILPLKRALGSCSLRAERLRYTFLLAQLYQQNGKLADAAELYRKVLRMNPPYNMFFNARINLAAYYQSIGKGVDMRKVLLKLASDEKNAEYLDQIYYALAKIEQAEGNTEKEIEYYMLSAQKSTENNNQKGVSYLALADYYFAKPNYTKAQAYYDSSYNSLDESYPDYPKLEVKTKNLNKLVENLNIINTEDSLQRVAKMPAGERDQLINSIINKLREEEDRIRREENEDRQRAIEYQQNQRFRSNQQESGKWYFYNQASLSYGQSEFQMKWGRRKLEDNWRRKNKRVTSFDTETPAAQQIVSDTSRNPQKALSKTSREYYLADLPTNDSLRNLSDQRIMEAMLKVAEVYQNALNDYNETVKAYENLIRRFPESPYVPQTLYNLYRVSLFNGNTQNAEKYKGQIITRYPESNYAKMLTNPNYLKEVVEKQKEGDLFYEETYNLFKTGSFALAQQKAEEGIERFKGSELEPKLKLLRALCVGNTADLRTFRAILSEIVEQYPKTEVAESASNTLAFLRQRELLLATKQSEPTLAGDTVKTTTKPAVSYYPPGGKHLFVGLIPKKTNINQLKFNLVSFNVDYFINLDLSVSSQPFNDFFEMIKVEPLVDAREAMEYYRMASQKEGLFNPLKPNEYSVFVISDENFKLFMEDKSIADYLVFFRQNYK